MNKTYHIPALLEETLDGLRINPEGDYVDVTFGGGGHSSAILQRLNAGQLIAFDQDTDAHKNQFKDDNFVLFNSNFKYTRNFLKYININKVDGIIADLGISTHHIDEPELGFSFRFDAPLSMRMNRNMKFDAQKLINSYPVTKLSDVLKNFGDLKNSYKIALAIAKSRKKQKISTTFDLLKVLQPFIPKKQEQKFLAKVFQALRIEVNDEINVLRDFLETVPEILKPNGRIAVISYHSIEDKIVKNFFRTGNFSGQRQTDMYGNLIRPLNPINNKVIVPSEDEIKQNNRARSAKLRIAEKK